MTEELALTLAIIIFMGLAALVVSIVFGLK
jgi:hypothetical protein